MAFRFNLATISSLVLLVYMSLPFAFGAAPSPEVQQIEKRAAEIETFLSDTPVILGAPMTDRSAWDAYSKAINGTKLVASVAKEYQKPIPEMPEDLYKEFYKNGNRSRYQNESGRKMARFVRMVFAEGIENKGRFVPQIEAMMNSFCSEPSWVLPAHDHNAEIYDGKIVYSDLVSTARGSEFAIALTWLGDKISPDVRKRMTAEIEKRVLVPYEQAVQKKSSRMWWVRGTNNWNSVCTAGTIGAALSICPSKQRRAWFLAAAEYYTDHYFFKGFTPDGYCSEGMGYWNYGFGNFVDLAAIVNQVTNNKLDFFKLPLVEKCLFFGPNMEIGDKIFAAFADCPVSAKPSPSLIGYVSRHLHLGMTQFEKQFPFVTTGITTAAAYYFSPDIQNELKNTKDVAKDTDGEKISSKEKTEKTDAGRPLPIRTEFPYAGVLICRPFPNAKAPVFGAVMKGGHNAELHNHNDVGSFSLVRLDPKESKESDLYFLDPGGETYTRRTFSKDRYVGELLNSFGHPVPRINGTLQKTGRDAAAKVLEKSFTDGADKMVLDITAAYSVKELEKLTRTFTYFRAGTKEQVGRSGVKPPRELASPVVTETFTDWDAGAFCLEDEAVFKGVKGVLETALVTYQKCETRQKKDSRIVVLAGNNGEVRALVTGYNADGSEAAITCTKTIVGEKDESVRRKPTRLGFQLVDPVEKGRIRIVIAP